MYFLKNNYTCMYYKQSVIFDIFSICSVFIEFFECELFRSKDQVHFDSYLLESFLSNAYVQ